MLTKSFTLFAACVVVATAQSSVTPSSTVSIGPAAETVASDATAANVPLFDSETVQLTDKVVSQLRNDPALNGYAALFEFEDSSNSTVSARARRVRKSQRCKTMPGDLMYPNQTAWGVFDDLLGGALEKIVPIASPCYKVSEYNNYDAGKCAVLVRDYNKEEI
jgi:hypothetical protein